MEFQQIKDVIEYAIDQFKKNDSELLNLNVSERAAMFHIARYIREKTPREFHVDCEYNRHLTDTKKLKYLKYSLGLEENYDVFPDIMIHKRNNDQYNLLVVEIKKFGINANVDMRKLEAFKNELYSYNFAVQMILGNTNSESDISYDFI